MARWCQGGTTSNLLQHWCSHGLLTDTAASMMPLVTPIPLILFTASTVVDKVLSLWVPDRDLPAFDVCPSNADVFCPFVLMMGKLLLASLASTGKLRSQFHCPSLYTLFSQFIRFSTAHRFNEVPYPQENSLKILTTLPSMTTRKPQRWYQTQLPHPPITTLPTLLNSLGIYPRRPIKNADLLPPKRPATIFPLTFLTPRLKCF
jgi:hypothetical protein